MLPSRGGGLCKALYETIEESAENRKEWTLSVLQKPLEQGNAVGFSTRLQSLFSGLELALCLALLTVAEECVKQLSHPPPLLTKPLDHFWELLQLSVRTEHDLGYIGHGCRYPLQHAP